MSDIELMDALKTMGLIKAGEKVLVEPLTGGVSSDIHLVEAGSRRFCVKRALARLKVASVWEAPLSRNAAEAAWMRSVSGWLPHAVPDILGEDKKLGLFAMAYLPPAENPVWKTELLAGHADADFAAALGSDLATIHRNSAADPTMPALFANDDTFEAIRIEPYLRATALAHHELKGRLEELATKTLSTKRALVHGDVSPKNILCGTQGPVFLDAECAWFGDPAFDLAFCLNHMLLKGARRGASRDLYLASFRRLAQAYLAGVSWEASDNVEARAAALLPALFLARVDGKSPVEYLVHDDEKDAVRRFAEPMVRRPAHRLSSIADLWSAS